MLVDTAKEANVDLFVWSGIQNMSKVTGGKYTHVTHFDGERKIIADFALILSKPLTLDPNSQGRDHTVPSCFRLALRERRTRELHGELRWAQRSEEVSCRGRVLCHVRRRRSELSGPADQHQARLRAVREEGHRSSRARGDLRA